jgi:hypothetical protein
VNVAARAVAAVSAGAPPPYSFVALNPSMEKHTLVIKTGGNLTVKGSIYTNSQNVDDGFDIFGSGGNISAPAIVTHGGWETHNGSTVTMNGVNCALGGTGGKTQVVFPVGQPTPPLGSQPPGCPDVGQPVYADPFAGQVTTPTPGAPACAGTVSTPSTGEYSPKQDLKADITAAATTLTTKTATTPISADDTIQIDSEQMYVVSVSGDVVTVTRGYGSTKAVAHGKNDSILQVTVTTTPSGTASAPAACTVFTGTRTLQPGTYYGGIAIGSSNGTCTPGSTGNAQVTLAAGTYIMAGGGLKVCGSSTLSAPNVLIYNTNDATRPTGNGAVGRVVLNTSGRVSLGPQATGPYQGLTIFQDATQAVSDHQCDNRSSDEWDIALLSMASTGANGALGSISGTIYAAHPHALFGDSVSGTANLAVFTGCIRIEGATSTFAFQSGGLFGTGSALSE